MAKKTYYCLKGQWMHGVWKEAGDPVEMDEAEAKYLVGHQISETAPRKAAPKAAEPAKAAAKAGDDKPRD